MTEKKNEAGNDAQIRKLVDQWAASIGAKDVEAVMSYYGTDVAVFDLAPPLEYRGAAAYRANWEAWFPTFQGQIGYELRELKVAASKDTAFSHSFNRITGTRTSGEKTDVWVRATLCWRRINGKWKIVHEHQSVPFYMDGSYRAAIDLKP